LIIKLSLMDYQLLLSVIKHCVILYGFNFLWWNIKTWIYIFILQLISFWLNLRSPDTCRLENILTSPPFSLTASTILIYLFLFCTSWDLAKQNYIQIRCDKFQNIYQNLYIPKWGFQYFQVYQYFTIYRQYFLFKFEQFS
jgi:hypothetical protein